MKALIRFAIAGAAGALVLACGAPGPRSADPADSPPAPAAALAPAPAASLEAVVAVAEKVFPKVDALGYYVACGFDGNLAGCPYTERLKTRLTELGYPLGRSQNPFDTREIVAEVTPSGAVAHVALDGGRLRLDLAMVSQDGRVLVDDETCAGRSGTSIYDPLVACA